MQKPKTAKSIGKCQKATVTEPTDQVHLNKLKALRWVRAERINMKTIEFKNKHNENIKINKMKIKTPFTKQQMKKSTTHDSLSQVVSGAPIPLSSTTTDTN